jgi:hypothetical protein
MKSFTMCSWIAFTCSWYSMTSLAQEPQLTREQILERAAVTALWEPQPPIVQPGAATGAAPSDAIVLFDGSNLDAWQALGGGPPGWHIEAGELVVAPGSGDIRTRSSFGDVQLHVEWATPAEVVGSGQGRGNSGVFLMERYEIQVLDSYDNPTYANGQAASIYKQHIPLVNASRGPGEWQSYDIIFTAPVFGANDRVVHPATVTVLHNGVLVHNHVALQGPTEFLGPPQYQAHGPAPIRLQDHANPVRYRNIWLRKL